MSGRELVPRAPGAPGASSEAELQELVLRHDAARGGQVLKEGPRGRVTLLSLAGREVVVKEDRPATLRSRLGRAWSGSRGARAAEAERLLRAAGFEVPATLAVLELEGRSLHVGEHVPGPTLSAALARAAPAEARALARAAAQLAARLHAAGFAFRDLKPPNLIVRAVAAGACPRAGDPELVPVDLDDVRRPRRLPRRAALRNLAALDAYAQLGPRPLCVAARLGALRAYAQARGLALAALLAAVLPLSRAKRRRLALKSKN